MKKTTKTTQPTAPSAPTAFAPAPAPKTAAAKVPKVKKTAAPASGNGNGHAAPARVTVITAKIDIGFGNKLFVRGEGPGLSWDKGLALDCVADDRWVVSLSDAARPVTFKFLLNDEVWSIGDDYVAEPGASFSVTPLF